MENTIYLFFQLIFKHSQNKKKSRLIHPGLQYNALRRATRLLKRNEKLGDTMNTAPWFSVLKNYRQWHSKSLDSLHCSSVLWLFSRQNAI